MWRGVTTWFMCSCVATPVSGPHYLFDVAVATLSVAGVLGLFALFSAGGALFCYAFVVETRGAALSDLQRLFSDQPPSEGDALLAPRV